MTTQTTQSRRLALRARPWIAIGLLAAAVLATGCQSNKAAAPTAANPSLRPIQAPAGGTSADVDRASLARFVGDWSFEGWATENGARRQASGRAAGVIENEHFVLLDMQTTSGQLSGRASRKGGSMLLASEPALGVTLTAWGDASPAISRFVGQVTGNASVFTFTERRTPTGRPQVSLTMTFQSDDCFVAEIHEKSASDTPVVASYTFTRSSR